MLLGSTIGLTAQSSRVGEGVFNANCAMCHGKDGTGGRGPNLRGSLSKGNLSSDLKSVIENGIPGTAMPKFNLSEENLHGVIRYVESLQRASSSSAEPRGDRSAGKRVYESNGCSACHEIDNVGSTFGPNLSRIGASRSYEYLKTSIVDPSADVPDENRTVRVITADGKQFVGIWVNEDSFTVQIRLPDESFASFDKQTLKQEVYEKESAMPVYSFSDTDLENLITYLRSLAGQITTTAVREQSAQP